MQTPVLETERLILRPLYKEDAEHIFKTWTSDPRVTEFMIYATHSDVSVTRSWLADAEKDYESDLSYNWGFLLKETGLLVGSGGGSFNEQLGRFNIGYNLAYDYWHKGLCTEAMRAVVDFAHSTLGFNSFVSEHAANNPRSGEVMKKLGMRFDHDGEYACFDGRVFDAKIYYLDY